MYGFNPGPIDGIFEFKTQAAVMAFQRSRNLVADGIVGVMTWTALGVDCKPEPTTCPIGTSPYTVNPDDLKVGQVICIP